jgi:hypothetical protein
LPTVVAEPELATAIRKPRRTAALPTVVAEPELATAIRKPGT